MNIPDSIVKQVLDGAVRRDHVIICNRFGDRPAPEVDPFRVGLLILANLPAASTLLDALAFAAKGFVLELGTVEQRQPTEEEREAWKSLGIVLGNAMRGSLTS